MRSISRRSVLSGGLVLVGLPTLLAARRRPVRAQGGFRIFSPAFAHGERIPRRHTCEGADVSPPLGWSGTPANARSLVLLCSDPDAPRGTWWHWGVYDIAPAVSELPEGHAGGPRTPRLPQAINDFGRPGYGGPCPPPGHGTHHYRFRLLALGIETLPLPDRPRCPEVEAAARPHVIAEAELVGTYSR